MRSLATQLAINPNTIQRAYSELEAEGYIYSVAGKGSFAAAGGGERQRRIRELLPLRRQARELAYHTAHYYDRGCHRYAAYRI